MTELVALATAGVVLATAVTTWRTRKQVQQVHVMVNSQRAVMTATIDQLKEALAEAGIAIPPAPAPAERAD
jgi:hypothetical protein